MLVVELGPQTQVWCESTEAHGRLSRDELFEVLEYAMQDAEFMSKLRMHPRYWHQDESVVIKHAA
jgi:hypothetical protein